MQSLTLFRYIGARTFFAIAAMIGVSAILVAMVDLVENLRFIDKFPGGDLWFAVKLSLLRSPSVVQTMLPFVFLFGSIWLFSELNRRAEIAVMRSAGLSVWRLLAPAAFIAVICGFLSVTLIDPASTRFLAQYEKMKADIAGSTSSVVHVFGDGMWLRQSDARHVLLLNARTFDSNAGTLANIVVWRFDERAAFVERIDAPQAVLSGRTIELRKARVKGAGERLDHRTPIYAIPTE
ncbi:MAG: LptF/LptG family permease, partial [Parvularculaceae bacterium]